MQKQRPPLQISQNNTKVNDNNNNNNNNNNNILTKSSSLPYCFLPYSIQRFQCINTNDNDGNMQTNIHNNTSDNLGMYVRLINYTGSKLPLKVPFAHSDNAHREPIKFTKQAIPFLHRQSQNNVHIHACIYPLNAKSLHSCLHTTKQFYSCRGIGLHNSNISLLITC